MEKSFPDYWGIASLEELVSYVIGGDWGKECSGDGFKQVFVLRGTDYRNWGKIRAANSAIRFFKNQSLEKRELTNGDIVLEVSGGGPDQPVGRVIAIDNMALQSVPGKLSFSNFFRLLRINKAINPFFVKYYLDCAYKRGDFNEMQSHTTNLRNLRVNEFLANTDVPIPPRNEQDRIVAKLDELMEKIDRSRARLERIPQILKRFRQSVLSAAVSGKLTEEWRARNRNLSGYLLLKKSYEERQAVYERELRLAKKNSTRKPSKPIAFFVGHLSDYDFPDDWAIALPEMVAAPDRYSLAIGPFGSNLKVSDYRSSGVPLVFVRHIRSNDFKGQDPKFVTKKKAAGLLAHSIESHDLVITKMGEPPGDCEIYPKGYPEAIITSDCLKFRVWEKYFNRNYFKHLINSFLIKDQLGLITQGVAQQKISLERFKTLKLPIPSRDEQNEIVRRIEQLFMLADRIEDRYIKTKAKINRLPQSLLGKAFSGDLAEQNDNDEPADILLERISSQRRMLVKKSKGKESYRLSSDLSLAAEP